jgi:hypothetical protein
VSDDANDESAMSPPATAEAELAGAEAGADPQRDPAATPRYSRRLSDKILISFHQACDQNDFEVARQLLSVYEFMLNRREMPADLNRRRSLDSLVAAHERLWHLRHPEQP